MSCRIRKAVHSDASAACELVRCSIEELCVDDHQRDARTLSEWLKNKTLANFEHWIKSDRHVALVAEVGSRLVGFGLLDLGGYVALLYVAPEARFSGVSEALLRALEQEAVGAGIQELKLESSVTALRFYQSAGYSLTGSCVQGFGVTSCYPMSRQIADA
jgi:GNAT superfamily N-acetyltransferase